MTASRGNILYVDDEEGNLIAFVASFRKYYDNIYTATSGREGLQIMRQHPIDVVLTDQRMPGMTGIQFLETIIPEFPDTIRMILTGFSDIEAVINAINTGRVFRYIQKPWDKNELKLNIDQAIKTHNLERANRELVDVLQKEVANKEHILRIFQKYVPANVINEVLSAEEDATYGLAESRIVTVLFSDIRGFTQLSDKADSGMIVQFLNDYFTVMSDCVEKHKGSVNKFIGDGILAIFGAPISYIDNATNAVFCALEMINLLEGINAKYEVQHGHKIEIGIGINTGEAITGTVGSTKHVEYTVIGDTVNTASRVEGLTKEFPNSILITQSTYDEIRDNFDCEALGPKTIRGKEGETQIYRVVKPKSFDEK